MANKHIDLFKVIIPAVDENCKSLWDEATEEERKEVKGDLWNLNRYISSVKGSTREVQEHYLLTVNEYYNKDWANISKHPKLQWLTLCMANYNGKTRYFHEWIPLKKQKNKKEELLAEFFPNMKTADIQTLAAITTDKEIKEYAKDLGWDKKQIADIKL